ncbi:class I SAM-dependent methyltransferase [Bacillus thermotolerans]|uniref:Adenine-specific methyltransferase n=1 Tax=Bacillus thermotolerans TaxID=1221996 RepID=A0A0F5ICV0_BACTR|nr:class I SAM-dependent methyltransferase [Bacillus thermotolerans]KKB42188.1 Adenine-specific methyltransferase [Bacillus thermotolerans]KKB43283.1 Adenine-specific methyltransferase [Bacillus thermotolerans]
MNEFSPIEHLFRTFDETASILQQELSCTYLDALAETSENLFQQTILQDEISEVAKKRIQKQYDEAHLSRYSKEEIRQAYQLAILKGMQENVQPNHQMTPDSIGLFISYLLERFMKGEKGWSILDPALGTGNLLLTVLNRQPDAFASAAGVEIDDLLLKLAWCGANLIEQPVQLFNQDTLEPLFIDPVDAVVCDLPVGWYPNDIRAADYELRAQEGHSYAHYLFIEQSIKHTKPGGYLFFLIPNGLFEDGEADKLQQFFQKNVYIQGLIQLPESMFKAKQAAKSILILQKQGEGLAAPKEVFLANMPSMKNKQAVQSIMNKMNEWFKENK